MFGIRKAEMGDGFAVVTLWTHLIEYHRSIEAFRPKRWQIAPEEAIRPLLAAAWDHPEPVLLLSPKRKAEHLVSSTPNSKRPAIVPPISTPCSCKQTSEAARRGRRCLTWLWIGVGGTGRTRSLSTASGPMILLAASTRIGDSGHCSSPMFCNLNPRTRYVSALRKPLTCRRSSR